VRHRQQEVMWGKITVDRSLSKETREEKKNNKSIKTTSSSIKCGRSNACSRGVIGKSCGQKAGQSGGDKTAEVGKDRDDAPMKGENYLTLRGSERRLKKQEIERIGGGF